MKKFFNLTGVLALAVLALTSCEIGLGSAVDTQPPTITITSPTDSYIVRENFNISGTISDDMGVTKVSVTLTNTDTAAVYNLPDATVNNETGTWTTFVHAVDKNGETVTAYQIPDGSYTAKATAYDSYEQTNVATKTFSIDNTPPLIVLKTPSTSASDVLNGTMYGQNFYLDGTAADDSYVSSIDVLISSYDQSTGTKSTVTTTIPKSNVTSLENVSFFRWAESNNYYDDLYGIDTHTDAGRTAHKNDGDKYYVFSINSYDSARKLPADSNDRGNVANYFYFYSYGEEYFGTKVLSQYKATGTYHLTNGTYRSSDSANSAISTSLSDASALLSTARKTEGSFRLNPINNPVFTVSGYENVNNYTTNEVQNDKILDATRSQFSIGGTMAVSFTQGNDSYSLMPETFGVELIEADALGNVLSTGNTYTLLAPWKTVAVDASGTPLLNAEGKEYLVETGTNRTSTGGNGDIKSSGTSYTISIALTNGASFPGTEWDAASSSRVAKTSHVLKEGYYWIHVTGYDQNGLDSKNNIKAVGMSFDDGPYSGTNKIYNYGIHLMGNAQAPSLEVTEPANATNYIGKTGDLTVKATIGNNAEAVKKMWTRIYLGSVKNENIISGSVKSVESVAAGGTDSSYSYTITNAKIAAAAGNRNGEVNVIVYTYYDAQPTLTCQRQFTVNYDCTAPVFESISVSPVVTKESVDYINGKVKIKANITDNAITTATYSLDNGSTKNTIENIASGFTLDTTDSAVASALNSNRLRLYAKDTAGNETEYKVTESGVETAGIELRVDQTTDAPVITLNNASQTIKNDAAVAAAVSSNAALTNVFGSSNNKIIGTVTEDDGFTSVKYKLQKVDKTLAASGGTASWVNLDCSGTTSVNLNIPLNASVKSRYLLSIAAVDSAQENTGYNNNKVENILIVVDDENPVISNVKAGGKTYSAAEQLYKKSSDNLTVTGNVSDDSGEVTVKRYTAYDAATGSCTGTGTAVTVTNGVWTDTLTGSDEATVYYQAEDPYGKKTVQAINYKIDDAAPEPAASVTISAVTYTYKVGSKTLSELTDASNPAWYGSTDVVFEGLYKEEQSGIKSLKYYVMASGASAYPSEPNGTITTSDLGSYENFKSTISNFKVSSGANHNKIKLVAEDYAGNKNESEYVIRVDENPPEIGTTLRYHYDTGSDAVLDGAVLTNGTKSITLSGTYSDDASGVDNIQLYIDGTAQSEEVTMNAGTWTVTMAASKFRAYTDGTNHPALLKVTDKAGNKGNSNSFTIKVDKTAPVVSVTTPAANSTVNGNITITGTTTEANTRQSIALKYKVGTAPTGISDTALKDGPSIVRNVNGKEAADIKNWSFGINAKTILKAYNTENSKSLTSADLYVVFQATDEAGNDSTTTWSSDDYIKYTISMDADRPTIRFSSITAKSGAAIKYSKSLAGSVSDDDGINHIYYSTGSHTLAEWRAKGTGITELTLSSGSFSIDNMEDGAHTFYFYLEDTDKEEGETYGGEYFTQNPSVVITGSDTESAHLEFMSIPKVQFKNTTGNWTTAESDTTGISFTVDNTPPVYTSPEISYSNEKNGTFTTAAKISEFTGKVGGTEREFIKISIKVSDSNSISSVTAKMDGYASPFTLTTTSADTTVSSEYTTVIDLSDLAGDGTKVKAVSGSKSITFTITDGSGIATTTDPVSITVDNDGPVFTIASPKKESATKYAATDLADTSDSLVVTGVVSIIGSLSDNSTVSDFKFKALNSTTAATTTAAKAAVKGESSVSFASGSGNTGTINSWTISVKGLPGSNSELSSYASPIVHNTTTNYYAIPVYFWAKDELGNETYLETYELKYDPFGDRPSAAITTPEADANLNGTIQILGTANDNVSVNSVYIQIDVDKDGDFDDADRDALIAMTNDSITNVDGTHTIYTVYTQSSVTGAVVMDSNANFEADDHQTTGSCGFWGIKANKTTSWNISVNKYKELQTDTSSNGTDTNKYTVYYRACAFDNNLKMGSWTSQTGTSNARKLTIDTNIPQLSTGGTIIGYSDAAHTTADGYQKTYAADMYLTSNGRYNTLKINITDKNGITKLEYYTATSIEELANARSFTTITPPTANPLSWDVEIPLTKISGSDSLAVKVVAYKKSDVETTAYCNYNINFDDTAPVINNLTLNSSVYAEGSVDRIVNSNGIFTLGGKVTDDGSGFARVAFYYYRNSTANGERIYDPLTPKASNKWVVNSSATDGSVQRFGEGTAASPKQKMFGTQKTVTVSSDKKYITLTAADSKIKAGGLVYINSTWLRIDSVSDTTITLDESTPAAIDGSGQTAFFPYVRVIDNTGAEKSVWGSDTSTAATFENFSDDGDGMPESVIKSQSTWTYDASIRSNFIPDGPGTLVIFAFDKAGNISAKSYEASVQNNAPRITKLYLGTDLNGSGTYTDNEFETYDILSVAGAQSSYTLNTKEYLGASFKVLDGMVIAPEFTGGNGTGTNGALQAGDIKMIFNRDASSETGYNKKPDYSETPYGSTNTISDLITPLTGTALTAVIPATNTKVTQSNLNVYKFVNSQTDGAATPAYYQNWVGEESTAANITASKGDRKMSFTFWDSTEDTTQGTNSCYCYLKLDDLIVNVVDTVPPKVVVNPFYWDASDDNSLYFDSDGNAAGHIDLSGDWKTTSSYSAANALLDGDPKVSGKVVIRGTVYDEHSISEIWAKFVKASDESSVFAPTNSGTADTTTGFYKVAYISGGNWTGTTGTVDGTEWTFEVGDAEYSGQAGTKYPWTLTMDTNGITNHMANDVEIYMMAKDGGSNSSYGTNGSAYNATSNLDSAKHVPYYQMDVVPYITGIKNGTDDASRSRLGRYPVHAGSSNTFTITGWNFGTTAAPTVYRGNPSGTEGTNRETLTVSGTPTGTSVTVECPEYSGPVSLYWSPTAYTLNNLNSEPSKSRTTASGKTTNKALYNIEEGELKYASSSALSGTSQDGVNYWTDDRYISVWNTDTDITGSYNPNSGQFVKLSTDNTDSGTLYRQLHNMDVTANSAQNNRIFSLWSSDDMQVYADVRGTVEKSASFPIKAQATFKVPQRSVAMTVVKGLPYYVLLDNWVGNSSANCWGAGLYLARDGYRFDNAFWEPDNSTMSCSEYFNVIEREGNSTPADARNSSGGYDSMQNQFLNPKIAGYEHATETMTNESDSSNPYKVDYVYISYYDAYARCLKYAGYKVAHTWSTIQPSSGTKWGTTNGYKTIQVGQRAEGTNMTTGNTVVAGYDTLRGSASDGVEKEFAVEAGEWSDIMIDPTSKMPVIIYYNKTGKCLEVAYGKQAFPVTGNIRSSTGTLSADNSQSSTGWMKTTKITPDKNADFGRYVSAKMDSNGNIHAAAMDVDNGKLYYIFLERPSNPSTTEYSVKVKKLVDGTEAVGMWTDIELAVPDATYLSTDCNWYAKGPVISYLNKGKLNTTNAAKIAYCDTTSGNFEAMTDPAKYEASDAMTSVAYSPLEGGSGSKTAKAAIGFNSSMYAIDFLRDEKYVSE